MAKINRARRARSKPNRSISNYTTDIPAEETAKEIMDMLYWAGASSIRIDCDDNRRIMSVSFRHKTAWGILTFILPVNPAGVLLALKADNISSTLKTLDHAYDVAWRTVRDWVEAQLAMIRAGNLKAEQAFLQYAQYPATGQTLYEHLNDTKFNGLLLADQG
jgi:hypothetical protein